jgi:hypothetical protein
MPSGQLLHQRLLPRYRSTREESTIRHYFLRFLIRFRSSFMDIVGWFLLSSTSFQRRRLQRYFLPILSFDSHHYGSGLAAARNNNPILLRHIHALLYFFLQITSVYCLYKYPLFWFPAAFVEQHAHTQQIRHQTHHRTLDTRRSGVPKSRPRFPKATRGCRGA